MIINITVHNGTIERTYILGIYGLIKIRFSLRTNCLIYKKANKDQGYHIRRGRKVVVVTYRDAGCYSIQMPSPFCSILKNHLQIDKTIEEIAIEASEGKKVCNCACSIPEYSAIFSARTGHKSKYHWSEKNTNAIDKTRFSFSRFSALSVK